jgi:hypothetical protein
VEASTQQPAGERETSAAAAKATATAMAMATGNAAPRHPGYMAATALVLTAEVAAARIAYDADGGDSGVTIVDRASLAAGDGGRANKLIPSYICCGHYNFTSSRNKHSDSPRCEPITPCNSHMHTGIKINPRMHMGITEICCSY